MIRLFFFLKLNQDLIISYLNLRLCVCARVCVLEEGGHFPPWFGVIVLFNNDVFCFFFVVSTVGCWKAIGRTTGKCWVIYVERHIWISISCHRATIKALALTCTWMSSHCPHKLCHPHDAFPPHVLASAFKFLLYLSYWSLNVSLVVFLSSY